MGAYTGSGTVSSGGESISCIANFIFNGAYHRVMQKTVRTVTRRSGVSLGTAQGVTSYDNTTNAEWWYYDSGNQYHNYAIFSCKGTRRTVSYSKIGDSNLYELEIVDEHLYINENGGPWRD